MYTVLKKPIISEKSMSDAGRGTFTFVVNQNATKEQIKKTVEAIYNVHVTDVAVVTTKGRTARFGKRRTEQKLSAVKKALVTLKQGEKIDLFDLAS